MPHYFFCLETYLHDALFILFQLCFIVQLYYLVSRHTRLAGFKPIEGPPPQVMIPVSVIISARNEARNLQENLPSILEQNYPDFEVVVINDCSYDTSDEVLETLQKQYAHLKVVTITEHDRFKTGKKFALTLGIKASKNEYLLFTDADCRPASENWISRMAANFTSGVQIILGYSPYYKTGGFINTFTRFETIKTATNYLSSALTGDPYMGIGRNLAYTKTLFFSAKGFASHMHVISGDDDLFVNQHATPDNTVVELNPESFMFTEAKTTFKSWFKQKKRHMGVGKLYKNQHRRMLSFDAVSGFIFYILLILFLILRYEPLLALGLCVFRLILQMAIYNRIFKKLNGKDLLWYLPFFDILYYMYLNVFGLIGTFLKTTQWK
ncbi:Glycosyltransferase, catalytic subunit of cellulose synthase and poly-beta-1,6-N-acetylglucosamine synthase [Mucilaginibacter gossypiicola]|uniref:Glycosyltransferase, catalytic subunit of cellulose synthase and poly-beta-1,6-N-acetylglucosamine synthase n=1 Tax=Mucilaginibacter gossypiicola TaxID=551995 RepID=A0A1H8H2H4_9SPHI|nr:Glycosyltransferase, catalytic subunit of cellulose synthase and poly-beta-1,6-N-acetylglucosamine synthase [Mucilaginibacter gossypiicola]